MVKKLLSEGDKVKVSVVFRGREITHPELGRNILQKMWNSLKGIAGVDRPLEVEEKNMCLIFSPLPAKPSKEAKKSSEESRNAQT
jgi:translation initiation factor IF-3